MTVKKAAFGLSAFAVLLTVNGAFAASGSITPAFCSADAAGPTLGNIVISGIPDKVHFVVNNKKVNAVCHFVDTSGVFEPNAEQQKLDLCTISTGTGVFVGDGHVVASATNQGVTGGNATIKCQADVP